MSDTYVPIPRCALCERDLWDEDTCRLHWARSEDGLRMEAVFLHASCAEVEKEEWAV